ncbi:MAG: uroporphyrinogen decarboxylase family protein [Anaerolineae bacterium]
MKHRERILAAIHHEPVDRIPTDMWATPEVQRKLFDYLQVDSRVALYDRLDIDGIMHISPPYIGPALPQEGSYWENEWGMGYRLQAYGTGAYQEQVHYPLAEAETIDDLATYTWPSLDWYDYSALTRQAAAYDGRAIECGYTALGYYHLQLRGQELALMDPLLRPELTHYLLQQLSDWFTEYHIRCFEATRGLVDMTQVTDDWGAQHGLLVSPRVFDAFYRAPTQRAIDLAKSYGLAVFHHDDGDMRPLLPTLAGMGVDILNPIQWRCGDWDLAALKAEYGARLCFHGGVDNQLTLPFGGPDDVRAEVRRLIDTLAADRTGFIIAPCHCLQAITPVQNIMALYEAAHAYRWRQ